ncbi:hypothetical protein NITGR_210010 [Nitrospina gracilis 3/211]|uniref:Uncharacterized protein n=1 Tax=Nitrospina gracilis (strain 3/211) TaxID=1266370 RepID=M1YX26_NITG3|nr:hypothetical protein NITGR_210010 [Nitrospina gracilis 3/211]
MFYFCLLALKCACVKTCVIFGRFSQVFLQQMKRASDSKFTVVKLRTLNPALGTGFSAKCSDSALKAIQE